MSSSVVRGDDSIRPNRIGVGFVECQAWCRNFDGGPDMAHLYDIIKKKTTPAEFDKAYEKYAATARIAGGGRCGWTPLQMCVLVGNVALARHLIVTYGAFLVNLGNEEGHTALHTAADLKSHELAAEFVSLFLDEGAHLNICGRSIHRPTTALMLARKRKHDKAVELLTLSGAYDIDEEPVQQLNNTVSTKRRRDDLQSSAEFEAELFSPTSPTRGGVLLYVPDEAGDE